MSEVTIVQKKDPLGMEPIDKLLLVFSVPSVTVCLVNSVYNIVDRIFIGQGVGYLGDAVTTVSFPMMTIVIAFAMLTDSGDEAYAAIKLGEQNEHETNVTLNNLFIMPLITGITIPRLELLFLDPLLWMFGATETIMPYAGGYTSIVLMGVPSNVLGITMSNMARTGGNSRLSMHGTLIDAALNTILDPLYTFVFHWGVKGAAIATITPQILLTDVLCHYFWKRGNIRLRLKLMRLVSGVCRGFLMTGAPFDISQLVTCVIQVVMNNSLMYHGSQNEVTRDVALSAIGIAAKIVMILSSFCIDIGVGSQPILGYNYGAGNYKRIQSIYGRVTIYATVSVSAEWLICRTMPHLTLSLFGSGNTQLTQFAVKCVRIYLGDLFCSGFQIVSTNYSQAMRRPFRASILFMMRQLALLIPLLLILPLFFGLDGILYVRPVVDTGSAIVMACFVVPSMKKLNRQIQEKEEVRRTQGRSASASV